VTQAENYLKSINKKLKLWAEQNRTEKISGMNILGKPGISFGSITYRRNYRACCSHKLFF
jgi:hypothetical protein